MDVCKKLMKFLRVGVALNCRGERASFKSMHDRNGQIKDEMAEI